MRKIIYAIITTSTIWALGSCHDSHKPTTILGGNNSESSATMVRDLLTTDSVSRWIPESFVMPDCGASIEVKDVGSYAEAFNDSNYVHWAEAEIIGLEPIADTRGHWQNRQPIEKITSCADFFVDELNYSSPYLVPKAARMVHEIGRRFHNCVKERSGADYRIKVTSVLRTSNSVKRLRRVNRNSVDSSTHLLGTTIDISYVNFICDNQSKPVNPSHLKAVLAEVLWDMREEGWCFVKYEGRQPCFHISCRDYK